MQFPIGRFAPTPSGPLHLGSLVTALGSFLAARAAGGRWLIRVDDLDRTRIQPGAEAMILRQLEAHGLEWDGAIRRQSAHLPEYEAALSTLRCQGQLYACHCTRAELAQTSQPGPDERIYSGACRERELGEVDAALRIRMPSRSLRLDDAARGPIVRVLDRDIGDFIVRRRDGHIAYQLACAVDEAEQGVTEVVRGVDLLGSSFKQIHLMQRLGLPVPRYLHLPLVLDSAGRKLSKQNHARALDLERPGDNLVWALAFLGQPVPAPLTQGTVLEIVAHACAHWRLTEVMTAAQQIT